MKTINKVKTTLALAVTLAASSACSDNKFCLGEPSTNPYDDVVICFALDNYNHFDFDGTDTWSVSGFGWNRAGGFAPIIGSAMTGIDQNGVPSYFLSYNANLIQKAQHDPQGVPLYSVHGAVVIPQDKLGTITSPATRFHPQFFIGDSFRENIMLNASLFGGACTDTPWTCWDLLDGKVPRPIVRYDLAALPFLKPQTGGY